MPIRRTHKVDRSADVTELVASARVDITVPSDMAYLRSTVGWSKAKSRKPWQWYEGIGEVHYALSRGARIAGYTSLIPRKLDKLGRPGREIKRGEEAAIVRRLESPYGGVRALAERYFTLMKVPAESYLIRVREDDEVVGWDFVSADELDVASLDAARDADGALREGTVLKRITMPKSSGIEAMEQEIEARDFLGRIWRPSSRYVDMTDSSLLANETNCDLLDLLTKSLRAKLMNRLMSNGIWYIPSEINDVKTARTNTGTGELSDNKVIDRLLRSAVYQATNPGQPEAALPAFVSGPAQFAEALRHITPALEIYEVEMKLRQELIDRILMGLDVQPQDVRGVGDSNHWCMDDQTQVFTRRGFVGIDEITVGDEALALNHETGLTEWWPVTDVYRADVDAEPMRRMVSRTHASVTTLHHRWPTVGRSGARRWRTSQELTSDDHIVTGAPHADLPVVPKHGDALVELAAWFWTEGNVGSTVSIAQSHTANPRKVDRLRAALISAFGVDGFTEAIQRNESSFGGPITVFRLRKSAADALLSIAPGKRVTDEFIDSLTLAQLHLFIDVSCMGDGHHWKFGERDIWQRDPEALNAYERACILAGYAVSRRPGHDGGTTVRALETTAVRPVKAAQQAASTGVDGATDEIIQYTGRIWCPTVAGLHSFLARRDGRVFYTGNSAWAVSDDERRINVQPEIETMCWALTNMVLRHEMRERGLPDGRIAEAMLWYDLTAANVKTNLAEDARQAHDRGLIGDPGARLLTGVDEAHAPTDDEMIRWVGRQVRDPYLATFGLTMAKDIDWTMVGKGKSNGPTADSPADDSESGPGSDSGSPNKNDSDTPRRLRPA